MILNRSWIGIVLAWGLLGAGCASAHRDASFNEVPVEILPTEAELTEQLTSEQPSVEQLRAFEVRAQQQVRDFLDYLQILSDTTLNSAFRTEARQQASQLFMSDEVQIAFPDSAATEPVTLQEWLADTILVQHVAWSTENLSIAQPLVQHENGQYEGSLSLDSRSSAPRVKIHLKRVTKQFGEQEQRVWEVFLGDIR